MGKKPKGKPTPDPTPKNSVTKSEISKYKDFQERISYLDDHSSESMLSKSSFNGLFNFLITLGLVKFVFTSYVNFKKSGYFIEMEIYDTVKRDYIYAISIWPLFYLYSHM